ncbi:MAG: GspH/FimT family pseudopilin [Candidatus Electrothrix sp. YB6]
MKRIKLNKTAGFSFAELMVVIALVGILSAIAVPNYLRSLPEKRLKNAARNLYADLQKARLLAVKSNKDVTVTFNTDEKRYSYPNGDNDTIVALTDYGAVGYGCNATATDWKGDAIPGSGVDGDLTFEPRGDASKGTVYLQSQNKQDVCYAVTVNKIGTVKIRRYAGAAWEK